MQELGAGSESGAEGTGGGGFAALARLDAARLEELALSCAGSEPESGARDRDEKTEIWRGRRARRWRTWRYLRGCWRPRAPICNVMRRLRELRDGRLEYGERPAVASARRRIADCRDGGASDGDD